MASERAYLGALRAKQQAHVKANHLTRDYAREKAYGVRRQPTALRLGVAENRARQDRAAYGINSRRIGSKGYATLLRGIFGSCGELALNDARRMLSHRAGTAMEDLYAYDLTAGCRLDSVTSSRERQRVEPSARMLKRVAAAVEAGHRVATMHNHPGSSMPSVEDILSLKVSGASLGVIVAHDGTIFTYEVVGEPAPGYTLSNEMFRYAYTLRAEDEEMAFEALEQLFGVKIVHRSTRA